MNYYDIFGLSQTASEKDINDTHRALAKKYHPDINDSQDAHEKMTKLNEAYEVLSDKTKRSEYDNKLKTHERIKTVEFQDKRTERAEFLRKQAEEKLKNEEKKRQIIMAQAKKRADKKAREDRAKTKKEEVDPEKQKVIDLLAMIHRKSDARMRRNLETDEERHYAIKVLLSLVRGDESVVRRKTEEAEHQQRIKEILALVNENNSRAKVE